MALWQADEDTQRLAFKLLREAVFTVESIAHLRGEETRLVPIGQAIRKVIDEIKKECTEAQR